MWCDGVEDLKIISKTDLIYDIEARVWIGKESDVSYIHLCNLQGTLMLNQKLNKLKRYKFYFVYKEKIYISQKGKR